MSDFAKLYSEVTSSEALRIQARIRYFADVFHIHARNYMRLYQLLSGLTNPDRVLPLWDIDKRDDLRRVLAEVVANLHNYLASARTLVEHTRTMMRSHYAGTTLLQEYQGRVDQDFSHDPISCFVHDLRNYMLHYSFPSTFAHVELGRDPDTQETTITSRTTISREPLLRWSGWSAHALTYLRAQPEKIDLLDLVDAHFHRVHQFSAWLLGRLNAAHFAELAWLADALSRLSGKDSPESPPD